MADAPDLGSGSERIGGSSPLARTMLLGVAGSEEQGSGFVSAGKGVFRQSWHTAGGDDFALLLVGAFAGVRHIEIQRLTWADVWLDGSLIEIRAKNAKTASGRMIPIVPNFKE